jgi:hypothetical protein
VQESTVSSQCDFHEGELRQSAVPGACRLPFRAPLREAAISNRVYDSVATFHYCSGDKSGLHIWPSQNVGQTRPN